MADDKHTPNSDEAQAKFKGGNPDAEDPMQSVILNRVIDKTERRERRKAEGSSDGRPFVSPLAMGVLRSFAHAHGLIVAGPCRLLGLYTTAMGDSDNVVEGRKEYRLVDHKTLFDGLTISDKWRDKFTEEVTDALDDAADLDIEDCVANSQATLAELEDERGRWYLHDSKRRPVALVVRIGEGETKHYLTHLAWGGGWYRQIGSLPYDLPLFGLPEMLKAELPVMIHEGCKAAEGAQRIVASKMAHPAKRFLSRYVHVGWQGAKQGIPTTDWMVLADRTCICAPDMDTPGLATMDAVAREVAKYGEPVEVIRWPADVREAHHKWDFADPPFAGFPTEAQIKDWVQIVESPTDHAGFVHPKFVQRSAYAPELKLLYTRGMDYRPLDASSFDLLYSPGRNSLFKRVVQTPGLERVPGADYRPGHPFGGIVDGRVNACPPLVRSHLKPSPLNRHDPVVKSLGVLMRHMVPNRRQRRVWYDRMAHVMRCPEKVPQFMALLRGKSSAGKSVLLVCCARCSGRSTRRRYSPIPCSKTSTR